MARGFISKKNVWQKDGGNDGTFGQDFQQPQRRYTSHRRSALRQVRGRACSVCPPAVSLAWWWWGREAEPEPELVRADGEWSDARTQVLIPLAEGANERIDASADAPPAAQSTV